MIRPRPVVADADVATCVHRAARGSTAFTAAYGSSMMELSIRDALQEMTDQDRLLSEPADQFLLRYTTWLSRQTDVIDGRTDVSLRTAPELVRDFLRETWTYREEDK